MKDSTLLHELISRSAERLAANPALTSGKATLNYGQLQEATTRFSNGLLALGLQRGERVAIYLDKRFETVIASFGAPAAGGVFVPLNPLLKAEQVGYILRDCNVRVLVTSPERLALLQGTLPDCHDLRHVVVVDAAELPRQHRRAQYPPLGRPARATGQRRPSPD
jgi:acyl-CoA synthetase (AMP-forming)/AMP-acid ligase II